MNRTKNARGFTLVELMIVVAIIGVLAAIAIPQFQNFLMKARRTSIILAADGIHKHEMAFYATNDRFSCCQGNVVMGELGLNEFLYLVGPDARTKDLSYSLFWFGTPALTATEGYAVFMDGQIDDDLASDYVLIRSEHDDSFFNAYAFGVPVIVQDDITFQ